ncbi:hypothetical protein [Ammoniphilus resinae]|uniref:Uncharacterized protein n=1 Tax=Ammoniphilus resinae TaxID=861532 RepID=A0ABS4GTX7_9BACL|nr:hypothetical protein [Ammoniphilus resinae]MBP1933711.1 hypothetical protein [Ammoniphilus resinae]
MKPVIIYKNKTYLFQLVIPRWWKPHVFVTQTKYGPETAVHFNLKYRKKYHGKSSCVIFSVVIFKMSKRRWMEQFGGSPFQFLGEKRGRVFAAIAPEEAPEEFLKEDHSDYDRSIPEFRALIKMENEDLPKILKSFRFWTARSGS